MREVHGRQKERDRGLERDCEKGKKYAKEVNKVRD